MKTKSFNDILKKEMKSNTFAKEYKKELKRLGDKIELPNFYKPKKKFAKLDAVSKVALFACLLYFVWLVSLLTNL